MSLFPRIGTYLCSTPGLGDHNDKTSEFDGRVLVIQWRRFVIEIVIGRRA